MTSVDGGEDADVVAGLLEGDETAFERLVRAWNPALLRLACVYVSDRAVAEEVVQDTWMAVLRGLGGFQGRSSLRTWTFGILVNRARKSAVRESRSVPFSARWRTERAPAVDPERFAHHDADPHPGAWLHPLRAWESDTPEDRLAARELQGLVEATIARLPRRQREIMTCRDVLGFSVTEVCTMFDMTANNQRVLLHRARGRCRAALETYLEGG